jgi:ABC-type lipoprotein release transport system permease subunit
MNEVLQIISSLWPIGIGVITLIVVLARMHYNLEALTEKVKVLFDFHNKREK